MGCYITELYFMYVLSDAGMSRYVQSASTLVPLRTLLQTASHQNLRTGGVIANKIDILMVGFLMVIVTPSRDAC